jgi:hypothetical protein
MVDIACWGPNVVFLGRPIAISGIEGWMSRLEAAYVRRQHLASGTTTPGPHRSPHNIRALEIILTNKQSISCSILRFRVFLLMALHYSNQ